MMVKQHVLTRRCQPFQQFNCLHNTFSRDLSLVIIGSHPTGREDVFPHPIPFDFRGETDLVFLQVLPFNTWGAFPLPAFVPRVAIAVVRTCIVGSPPGPRIDGIQRKWPQKFKEKHSTCRGEKFCPSDPIAIRPFTRGQSCMKYLEDLGCVKNSSEDEIMAFL